MPTLQRRAYFTKLNHQWKDAHVVTPMERLGLESLGIDL